MTRSLHPFFLSSVISSPVDLYFHSALGIIVAVIEYPLVKADFFNSPSSYMPKVAFFIPVSVLALLEAQTVNGGVYLAIGTVAYLMAIRADFLKQQSAMANWSRMP